MTYTDNFASPDHAARYDNLYDRNTRDRSVWRRQRKWLTNLLPTLVARPERVLDFACGTGRILDLHVEVYPLARVDGVDISQPMLDRARARLSGVADLHCTDITADRGLCTGPYDLITAFRFFLNADPEVAARVLEALRTRLRPNGIVVLNNHGNRHSARTALMRARHTPDGVMANTLDHDELVRMAGAAGLRHVGTWGMSPMPDAMYRVAPQVAEWLDTKYGVRSSLVGPIEVVSAFSRP